LKSIITAAGTTGSQKIREKELPEKPSARIPQINDTTIRIIGTPSDMRMRFNRPQALKMTPYQ
jgi:hypothetical protein